MKTPAVQSLPLLVTSGSTSVAIHFGDSSDWLVSHDLTNQRRLLSLSHNIGRPAESSS